MAEAGTKTQYHHGNLREELIGHALMALQNSGVEALSLRHLARELGVSQAAPRRHFDDKAALLDELAIVGFARLASVFASISETGDFERDITSVANRYLQFAVENSALLDVMFTRKHGSADIVAASHQALARVTSHIISAQDRGEVVAGDPEEIGTAVFSAVQGIVSFANAGILDLEQAAAALRSTLGVVFNGVVPRP